jgi:hypothetical protein
VADDDKLDDDERALIAAHRAEKAAAAKDDREVWIRSGDREASVPYSEAKKWLADTFGIGLDDEPVQDSGPEPKDKGKTRRPAAAADDDPGVVRFGRKMG